MRTEALAAISRACHSYGGRKNNANRWAHLRKEGHVHDDDTASMMDNCVTMFNATLLELKTKAKNDISSWTLSSAPSSKVVLENMIQKLNSLHSTMAVHVSALEQKVKQQKKVLVTVARKSTNERKRLLSNWRESTVPLDERVPMSFLRYMLDNAMLVDGHGEGTDGTRVASHDGDSCDLDQTRPWLVLFTEGGPGKDMSLLQDASGERRLQ